MRTVQTLEAGTENKNLFKLYSKYFGTMVAVDAVHFLSNYIYRIAWRKGMFDKIPFDALKIK